MTFPPPQVPPPLPRAAQSAPRKPRARRNNYRQPGSKPTVTNAVISINVGLYLWMSLSGFDKTSINFVISRQFLEQGDWYRLLSCGFVHFGVFHLAMNMLLAYQLGQMFEQKIGSLRFGLLYFTSLLGGSVGALIMSPEAITGGASGAVFGLMAASFFGMRQQGINPLQTGLGLTFVLNIVITLAIPGISIGGHFGGAAIGALCGLFVLTPTKRSLPKFVEIGAPVVISLALILAAVNFVNA